MWVYLFLFNSGFHNHGTTTVLRFHMAQWYDAHERAGHYLTDANVAAFRRHCDT